MGRETTGPMFSGAPSANFIALAPGPGPTPIRRSCWIQHGYTGSHSTPRSRRSEVLGVSREREDSRRRRRRREAEREREREAERCRSGRVPRSTRTATHGSPTSAGRSTRPSPGAGSGLCRRSPASASAAGTKSTGSANTASTSRLLSLQNARSAVNETSGRRTTMFAQVAPRSLGFVPSAAPLLSSLLEGMLRKKTVSAKH